MHDVSSTMASVREEIQHKTKVEILASRKLSLQNWKNKSDAVTVIYLCDIFKAFEIRFKK